MNKIKFRPLGQRVQFERLAAPAPAPGQVIVSPKFEASLRCRVLSVGAQCEHVKPKMIVIIPLNCGMAVENVEGRVCREEEIVAMEVHHE
jgi:hypothetical protein